VPLSTPSARTARSLPRPRTAAGDVRRVGVEVELGGLDEKTVADAVRDVCGGTITDATRGRVVKSSAIGDVEVYLDSRFLNEAKDGIGAKMRELAGAVVPVEIVTAPLRPDQIGDLDSLMAHLRDLGATGTNAGVLLGFGVHFNPEVTGETLDDILPTLTAYALAEDALRAEARIDLSRRALPFVDPYPRALVDALARGGIRSVPALIDLYLKHAASRNYGLDMLALFTHLDRDRVAATMDLTPIGARPTYHLRLPDCRIDEPGWSLVLEWNRWVRVEQIAADPDLLAKLAKGWQDHRAHLTSLRGDWAETSGNLISEAGL
jgi:hypothetical protein